MHAEKEVWWPDGKTEIQLQNKPHSASKLDYGHIHGDQARLIDSSPAADAYPFFQHDCIMAFRLGKYLTK
jgi:hypothetical protein